MPGTRCSIPACNNALYKTKKSGDVAKVAYHSFPNDLEVRKKWVRLCRRTGKWNPNFSRVCSAHFSNDDYERDMMNELLNLPIRRILKATAVPSLLLRPHDESNPELSETRTVQSTSRSARQERRTNKQIVAELLDEASSVQEQENPSPILDQRSKKRNSYAYIGTTSTLPVPQQKPPTPNPERNSVMETVPVKVLYASTLPVPQQNKPSPNIERRTYQRIAPALVGNASRLPAKEQGTPAPNSSAKETVSVRVLHASTLPVLQQNKPSPNIKSNQKTVPVLVGNASRLSAQGTPAPKPNSSNKVTTVPVLAESAVTLPAQEHDYPYPNHLTAEEKYELLEKKNELLRNRAAFLERELQVTQAKLANLSAKQIKTSILKKELDRLKKQSARKDIFHKKACDALSKVLTPSQIKILVDNKRKVVWDDKTFSIALTLRNLNPRAYVFVRNVLKFPLPGSSTLNHWELVNPAEVKNKILKESHEQIMTALRATNYNKKKKRKISDSRMAEVMGERNTVEMIEVCPTIAIIENGPTEIEENGPTEMEENGSTEMEENGPTEMEENGPTETEENGPTETEENGATENEEGGTWVIIEDDQTIQTIYEMVVDDGPTTDTGEDSILKRFLLR